MRLIDALLNVEKSVDNEAYPDWDAFCNACDIYDYLAWSDDPRLKGYWMKTWICTDTAVGYAAYFLEGELVAMSELTARKNCVKIKFMSDECGEKVKELLLDILGKNKTEFDTLTDIQLNSEPEWLNNV